MKKLVSVIIPTFNDTLSLRECLKALEGQSLPRSQYEIIVVNNSPEKIPLSSGDNISVVHELKPGSYAARNAGIRAAHGKILAFTDADCVPDSKWLESGLRGLREYRVKRIAGRVSVFSKTPKKNAVELYETIVSFNQELNVAQGLAVTANLFVSAEIFQQIGLFNSDLYSGGDMEWNRKASLRGIPIRYGPEAIVHHPARTSWKELAAKAERVSGGLYYGNLQFKSNIIRAVAPPVTDLRTIIKNRDAKIFEKILAFFVAYRLKIYRHICIYKIRNGKLDIKRS